MAGLTRSQDWSATLLGPSDDWPQSLKTTIAIVLASPLAMVVLWGPDLIQVYNDEYAVICGPRHPRALGQRTRDCWPEVWEFNAPIYEAVLRGETRSFRNQRLTIERLGRSEDAWFDLTYSAVRDEQETVAGVLVTVVETTDRMVADMRISAERERQRRQFEQAPGFICVSTGPEHVYEFGNEAYARVIGRRDFVGKTVREALPDIEGQGFYELLDKVYATGERHVAEDVTVRMQRAPGADPEVRHLDFVYEPVLDEGGRVTGVFTQGHDVTDAHHAREALLESESRQSFLLAFGDEIRDVLEPTAVMASAARLLGSRLDAACVGYSEPDEADEWATVEHAWAAPGRVALDGKHRLKDYGPALIADLRAGLTVRVDDVLRSAATAQRAETYDAIQVRAFVVVPLIKGGHFVAFLFATDVRPRRWSDEEVGIFEEIADRTWAAVQRARAEAKLRSVNAELERRVVERTRELSRTWHVNPDLLSIHDANGCFETTNPAWQATLGWSAEDLAGSPHRKFVHPDDLARTQTAFDKGMFGEPVLRFENRYRHQDGSYRWLQWVAVREGDKLYSSARDVTAEKDQGVALHQAEEHMRQSQKLEAVGQLTGGVAHDFNNLLTIISSSVDFLRRSDLPEARRVRYVEAISATVTRASTLTSQLLAFARRQPLKPTTFDAGVQVRGVVELVRPLMGSRIEIECIIPAEECFVEVDKSQFETALVNLAVNARDAMDGEGRLRIELAKIDRIPTIRGHLAIAGAFVALSIADDGSGIEASHIANIFEPFFTTKEVGRGTGLGLSQVLGFAKQSGGEIGVNSEVGRGTTFTLYLPGVAASIDTQALPIEPNEDDTFGQGRRLLIVEDNEAVGSFATQMLGDIGYATHWVGNAADALAILAERGAEFDAVFSDVIMPGMSGLVMARIIKDRNPNLPVVLTSGYSDVIVQEGHDGFELVQKPYSIATLTKVLHRAMSPPADRGARR